MASKKKDTDINVRSVKILHECTEVELPYNLRWYLILMSNDKLRCIDLKIMQPCIILVDILTGAFPWCKYDKGKKLRQLEHRHGKKCSIGKGITLIARK